MRKIFYSLISLILIFAPAYSFAFSNPNNIQFDKVKSVKLGSSSASATYIFNSANGSYAVKNKVVNYSNLSKIMRLRALSRFSGVGGVVVSATMGSYLDQLIAENGWQYDSKTGEFGKPIPSLYRVRFGSMTAHYETVDAFLSATGSATGFETFIKDTDRQKLETAVSVIDYSKLKISAETPLVIAHPFYYSFKGANYSPSFPFPTAAVSNILVQQYGTALDDVVYNPDGTPQIPVRVLKDADFLGHVQNAPIGIITDLLTSSDPDAEGHNPMIQAYQDAKPYDPATDKYIDPNDETDEPDIGTPEGSGSPFELPPFCSWAGTVCDFMDWVKADPNMPEIDETLPTIHDVNDFDNIELDKSVINATGQCPAPEKLDIGMGVIELSYTPLCTILEKLSGVLVACAYISGAYMIIRSA